MTGSGSQTRVAPRPTHTAVSMRDASPCGPGSATVADTSRRTRAAPGPTSTRSRRSSPPTGPARTRHPRDPGGARPVEVPTPQRLRAGRDGRPQRHGAVRPQPRDPAARAAPRARCQRDGELGAGAHQRARISGRAPADAYRNEVPDPGGDPRGAGIPGQGGEQDRQIAALGAGVAVHHVEVGPYLVREVGLVDDEQIRAGHPGAALVRDLVAARDIDDEDLLVDEAAGEGGGEIVAVCGQHPVSTALTRSAGSTPWRSRKSASSVV